MNKTKNHLDYAADNILSARKQIATATQLYSNEISNSIKNSIVYESLFDDAKGSEPDVKLVQTDTKSAALACHDAYPDAKIAVLNFASYNNPGGGFTTGSNAQEEMLCRESTLYPVISNEAFDSYYNYNRSYNKYGLYGSRAIYSPNIIWTDANGQKLGTSDVITCAAPNANVYLPPTLDLYSYSYIEETHADLDIAMLERMQLVKAIAEDQQVDALVLGAWGCGAFGFNALKVADDWRKTFEKGTSIKHLVYAVYDKPYTHNYDAFVQVLGGKADQ